MECKFLDHGLALAYQETIKPCCTWQFNEDYKSKHQLHTSNLINWHKHDDIVAAKKLLQQNIWPKNCAFCENQETQGRMDSMRLNGMSAYKTYQNDDLTLEIRPGSVCNFACQTCWPAASSRVSAFYKQADIPIQEKLMFTSVDIDKKTNFDNFDFLQPIAHRIKSVVLLGGEPFYDKNCLQFLDWWDKNTQSELLLFTNGSQIKFDFLEKTTKKITLVFSLDAAEKPAEYIRFGTEWDKVYNNLLKAQTYSNVDVRINITQSVYNYVYLDKLLELFIDNWPSLITFGPVFEAHFNESVIPLQFRQTIIDRLNVTINKISQASIEQGQKQNAMNAIASTINNLNNTEFNLENWEQFKDFVGKMDKVKGININHYCPEVAQYIY
jgi:organic radical activating enzyme